MRMLRDAPIPVETRVDAYRDEDVTKTAAGMRTIPLGAAVVATLREWRQRSAHPGTDDLVFPNRCGAYDGHDNMVKRRFLPLFRKLTEWHAEDPANRPLPPARFNWHALRHFTVSCWIEAGLSPKMEWAPWGGQKWDQELTGQAGFRRMKAHGTASHP